MTKQKVSRNVMAVYDRVRIEEKVDKGFAHAKQERLKGFEIAKQERIKGFSHASAERFRLEQKMDQGFKHAQQERIKGFEQARLEREKGFLYAAQERARLERKMDAGFEEARRERAEIMRILQRLEKKIDQKEFKFSVKYGLMLMGANIVASIIISVITVSIMT